MKSIEHELKELILKRYGSLSRVYVRIWVLCRNTFQTNKKKSGASAPPI